jgi:RHS repeat-associated protein
MKFTGHERDESLGLDYMLARYYSAGLGRFLSVDPSQASCKEERPGSWLRYAYASGNPINRYDPDGEADHSTHTPHTAETTGEILERFACPSCIKEAAIAVAEDIATNLKQSLGLEPMPLDENGLPPVLESGLPGPRQALAKISSRAARRIVMRRTGVPTSQQPVSQSSPRGPGNKPAGRELTYDTPKGEVRVQHQLQDAQHGPHWEGGKPKPGGQTDPAGRPRLANDKVKVDETPPVTE